MSRKKLSRASPAAGKAADLLLRGCARLPLPTARGVGALLGWALWAFPNSQREISRLNIDLCLPEVSPGERRRILRASLIETGKTHLEMGAMWHWPMEKLDRLHEAAEGAECLDRALARGKGAMLLIPHLGNWEFLNVHRTPGHPWAAIYRPPRLAELEQVIRRARERSGAVLGAASPAGIRSLYRCLREGGLAVVMPDQEPVEAGGRFAPFFGLPALTMTLVSRLLHRTGAGAVFGYALRESRGGFTMHFREASPELASEDPDRALRALNRGIEECVRAAPEQYQWAYKRFKTRPPGELTPYRVRGRPKRVTEAIVERLQQQRV